MQHFLIRISRCIPAEIEMHVLLVRLLATSKGTVCFMRQSLIEFYSRFRCFVMILAHTRYKMTMTMIE